MSAEIIPFSIGKSSIERKLREDVTAWVPEYRNKLIDGVAIPYWTGKEVLCKLIKNPKFTGDCKAHPYEIPYNYEVIGEIYDPIRRDAIAPSCSVNEFDWDLFEQKAVRA